MPLALPALILRIALPSLMDGGSIGIDESTVASGAAWISEGGGSTRGRLSRVLKYSRHLVTIDAPFDRRLFPSAESSGEDIFIWFKRRCLKLANASLICPP